MDVLSLLSPRLRMSVKQTNTYFFKKLSFILRRSHLDLHYSLSLNHMLGVPQNLNWGQLSQGRP